jgi:predicted RNA-binding Zn ribbon-like protein
MIRPFRQIARIGLGTLARRRLELWDPGWANLRRSGAWPAGRSVVAHLALLATIDAIPSDTGTVVAALERLHSRWTAAVGRSRLVLEPERATPAQLAVGLTPGLLVPDRVADAAVDVVRTADLARLRRCPPDAGGCGWVFLDHSRNGSRRWCRMADCGTTAKARRLTERRRAARTPSTK